MGELTISGGGHGDGNRNGRLPAHPRRPGRSVAGFRPGPGPSRRTSDPRPPDEREESVDLKHYLAILRRRWRVVAGAFAVVVVGVAVGTWLQDPVYRATGTLEIRRAEEGLPAAASSQAPRITDQYLETEYEILRSPALARRAMAILAIARGDVAAPDELASMEAFRERLIIDPVRGSRLIRIHFDAGDRDLAADVVNTVIGQYTEMRVDAALAAESQLASQADSVREQLAISEQRLQEYMRNSGLVFLETGSGGSENIVHERLRQLQQELTAAEAVRYEKESRYNMIRQQGVEHLGSDVLRSLSTRVADLRVEYARLRSTFTDDYPRTQQVRNQLDELERLLISERRRIAGEVATEFQAADRRQQLLRQAFEEQRTLVDQLAGQSAEYNIRRREVEGQQALFTMLQQKQKEAGVSAALAYTEVGLVNAAVPPVGPIRPVPARNMQLAIGLGLVLGVGLAFLREHLDGTLRSAEEVDDLSDRPVLALIPASDTVAPKERSASMAEAFAVLRTSILWNGGSTPPRTILITSAQPEEGKTTVSTSLACSLAAIGHRVLLIDADTRRPAVDRVLHLRPGMGLVDHLRGEAPWRDLLQQARVPGLDVLPSGEPPDRPVDLLASPRMRQVINEAQAHYDFVVVDSPAVFINAADARILAPLVDNVLLVIRSGVTPRDITARVLKLVPQVSGVVMNGLDIRNFPSYYGRYTAERHGSRPKPLAPSHT